MRILLTTILLMLLPMMAIAEPCTEDSDAFQCAKCAIYHEARGETFEGQVAIAIVLLNRVAAEQFPDELCDVVWQKGYVRSRDKWVGQFSFTTDGKSDVMKNPQAVDVAAEAVVVATLIHVLDLEEVFELTKDVLWYHTNQVSPNWSTAFERVTRIDSHIFYSDT